MIIDARSLSDNQKVETDVCIAGAGTAGLTLAREFLAQGFILSVPWLGGFPLLRTGQVSIADGVIEYQGWPEGINCMTEMER